MVKRPGNREAYADPGISSTSHLSAEMFMQAVGIEIPDVVYRGGGPAIHGLLAGEAGMLFMPSSTVPPFMQSGELRALAVTTRERSPLAPEVPAFAKSGAPSYESVEPVGMPAPTGTPAPVVSRLNAARAAAPNAPDMQDRLKALAITPMSSRQRRGPPTSQPRAPSGARSSEPATSA